MSAPEAHQLSLGPLTGVSFGPDRTRESTLQFCFNVVADSIVEVAISPNNNEAQVYSKQGDGWSFVQALAEVSYGVQSSFGSELTQCAAR